MRTRSIAAAACLLLAAGSANAAVLYEFSTPGAGLSPGGSFALTLPDFLTAQTLFAPGQFDSCSTDSGPCQGAEFYPVTEGILGPGVFDAIRFDTTLGNSFHYFADGAFGLPGTYSNLAGLPGTLTVTNLSPEVPEPATWAMLVAGFGLLGAALRRRRTLRATSVRVAI